MLAEERIAVDSVVQEVVVDSVIQEVAVDTVIPEVATDTVAAKPKRSFFRKVYDLGKTVIDFISEVDTVYVREQEYNWSVMMQSTTVLEAYKLVTKSGQSLTFVPENSVRIGPYGGWRWIFLGKTLDLKTFSLFGGRVDWNLSFYTPVFTIDFIWRESGDYKISRAILQNDIAKEEFDNIPIPGMESFMHVINLNYVFNHKKFSYPAAFAQSGIQKISAGSPVVGIGYNHQKLTLDYNELVSVLDERIEERFPGQHYTVTVDSTLRFNNLEHKSLVFSGGYAYNFVLTRNFFLSTSLTLGLAFRKSIGEMEDRGYTQRNFNIRNVNFDGCGRVALVYNNMRWYVGANAVAHYYSNNKTQFRSSNWLGTINLYVGVNFGKKKK